MKIVSTLLLLALCLSLLLTSCSLSDLFPKNETESQTKGETDAQTIETDGKGSETATETEPDHESETAAEETDWRYTTEGIVACFNRYEYKQSWYDEEFRNYLKEHTEYLTGNVLAMVQITDQITENEEDRTYADVVELENEADAIAYAEDRAKALAETEGENALCLRYGRIVVFGTSPILSRIQAGTVTHPTVEQVVEKFDEDVFELEWMNKTLIAFQENALDFLKGHILTVARLTDTKTGSEEWAGICEFKLEEDAVAFAADRTAYLEENEPGKGICFQYGCIVVFGTANVLNEIKPAD
ncbi:MAG: hypothetical protein II710_06450 [Clostridia bacterium]|nr:hypothetical protein [Clostridia bacterium]